MTEEERDFNDGYKHIKSTGITYDDGITIRSLKYFRSDVQQIDIDHDCSKDYCSPKCIKHFTKTVKKYPKVNPNIFICKYGKFHDCNEICPGKAQLDKTVSCCISGYVKHSGFNSSLEYNDPTNWIKNVRNANAKSRRRRRKRGLKIPYQRKRKDCLGIYRDNTATLLGLNGVYSVKRDNLLNKLTYDKLKKQIMNKRMVDLKMGVEIFKIKVKKNRLKQSTRQVLKSNTIPLEFIIQNSDALDLQEPGSMSEKKMVKQHYKMLIQYDTSYLIKLYVYLMIIPIKLNNVCFKKAMKKKRDNIYPIFFGSESLFFYVKCKLDIKTLYMQLRNKVFHDLVSEYTEDDDLSLLMERIVLKITPGLSTLKNIKNIQNNYVYLQLLAKNYIYDCLCKGKRISLPKLYNILSYDIQLNNEKTLNTHVSVNGKEYWDMYTEQPLFLRQQVIPFLQFEELKYIYAFVLKVWTMIFNSGSLNKCKRKTKDPMEIILAAIAFAKDEGICKYNKYNCYNIYIPSVLFLSKPGYLLFENKFNNINKRSLRSLGDGCNIVYDVVEKIVERFGGEELYKNFVHPFHNNYKLDVFNKLNDDDDDDDTNNNNNKRKQKKRKRKKKKKK